MEEDDGESNPPLKATYKHLLLMDTRRLLVDADDGCEVELPVIDLGSLDAGAAIVRAASEWGFFQVTGHGVPAALLEELRKAQVRVFRRPFERKVLEPLPGFSPESYRWGTPTATCLEQLSWSEAYHIPMMAVTASASSSADDDDAAVVELRAVIQEVSAAMSRLAQKLAGILAADLTAASDDDEMPTAREDTCFLRLNRYPPCGASAGALFGLCPHTDSDFLTILHQDAVGGLQLRKAGRWVAVRPNPGALIVNVGDLLQAWSNDRYRSVEHRVVASAARERFSVAFFLCPAYDTVIRPRCTSSSGGPQYKSFTFGEYRNQIREDVRLTGRKLGLQRFRLHHHHNVHQGHI